MERTLRRNEFTRLTAFERWEDEMILNLYYMASGKNQG